MYFSIDVTEKSTWELMLVFYDVDSQKFDFNKASMFKKSEMIFSEPEARRFLKKCDGTKTD